MKLKRYNKKSVSQREPGSPNVYIHNGGSFVFNQPAALLFGIKPDGKFYLEIIQDEDNPKDWFVTLSDEENGILLRPGKKAGGCAFNSGVIAKEVLKTLPKSDIGTTATKANLLIAGDAQTIDGLKLWPIITSSYQPKAKK